MQQKLLPEAEQFAKQNRRRRIWQRIVTTLACVVVFCTTYALILPAITQETPLSCGLEEHIHTDECWTQIAEEPVLVCTESTAPHVHTTECYQTVEADAASEGHQHDTSCYETRQGDLTCTLPEESAHTHSGDCYTVGEVLTCTETAENHVHGDACYQQVLSCTLAETEGHQHGESCYAWSEVLVCGQEVTVPEAAEPVLICTKSTEEAHVHGETCYEAAKEPALTCTLEENEEHTHSTRCYGVWALTCEKPEHTHELACHSDPTADVETAADWEAAIAGVELTGVWADDVLAIAESQLGYHESTANYIVIEDDDGEETKRGYTRYGAWYGDPYGDWCAMFVSFCLNYAGVDRGLFPIDANCQNWISTLQRAEYGWYQPSGSYVPNPGDLVFFDWNQDGTSDHVGLVETVTAGTETEAIQLRTIEGNSSNQVQYVNYSMDDLDIIGYGQLPAQLSEEEMAQVEHVITLIDEMPSADEIDAKIEEFEEAEDYEGEEAWLTEVYQQVAQVYHFYAQLTDAQKARVTNADKLLELEYIWSVATLAVTETVNVYMVNEYSHSHYANNVTHTGTIIFNGGTPGDYDEDFGFAYWTAIVVEEKADGSLYVGKIVIDKSNKTNIGPTTDGGFVLFVWESTMIPSAIDVHVGDVVSAPFDRTQTGSYTGTSYGTITFLTAATSNTADVSDTPTVVPSASTSEFIELNLYDFGSNINDKYSGTSNEYPGFQWNGGAYYNSSYDRHNIDSIDFGNSLITDMDYTDTNSDHGKSESATSIAKANGSNGRINALVEWPDDDYANKPIGMTNGTEVLSRVLNGNGYPQLAQSAGGLGYLFGNNDTYSTKLNSKSIDGLFQIDEETGAYYYNSRWNHAQFNDATDTITLYEEIITPNFITYPFGNFLPLNTITDLSQATQVGAFNYSGGVANYVNKIENGLSSSDASEAQLLYMLNQYKESWTEESYNNNGTTVTWTNLSAANAIRDYFLTTSGNNPSDDASFITESHLDKLYNIDWDVETNFFYSMEMKMNFMQPKGGITGNDTNGDGTSDYPMRFYFTGDDDVWVYIDGVLFLDLSGIHRHVGGEIDFVNGKVRYYALDTSTGDVSGTPYKTYSFAELLTAAGKSTSGLNANGTFADYTTHSFNFYYMERGSGSSVCRLNFNFPLLKQNSISVGKEVSSDVEIQGNPDYKFQVLKANADGSKTNNLFIAANTEYTIYDMNNNVIGTGKTDANGVITLKAGQRAEFAGIKENAGKYYVRELLDDTILGQYGNITVSGESTTTNNNVTVGSDTFTGRDSPVKDMSDGATLFRFTNDVDEVKLGTLQISKQLTEYPKAREIKYYDIEVTLDGVKLPAGTEYTVGGTTKTVETTGIITIAADETAVISNILSGTQFTVQETSGSAEGYTVTYSEEGGYTITVNDGKVTGVIKTSANVQLVVTNSEKGASVTIPGTKSMTAYDGKERIFTFRLTEVEDSSGTKEKDGGLTDYTTTATVTDAPVGFSFTINYAMVDMGNLPQTFYYKITENASEQTLANDTAYVAEVKVESDGSGGIKATLVQIHGSETNSADFVNTLYGDLTIGKIVDGGTEAQSQGFTFEIKLDPGTSGVNPLPTSYAATYYQQDGSTVDTKVTVTGGVITLREFKHGETAVIHGIPYGVTWTITETTADGYKVTYTVNKGESTDGTVSTGTITTDGAEIVYTNTALYALPETGGSGTIPYTMAGWMLMLCSMAYLLYRFRKRRREVT